jgi:hypothetical protein
MMRSLLALLLVVVTQLSGSSIAFSTHQRSHYHPVRRILKQQQRHEFSLFSMTSSSSMREKLESMTVKELRDLLNKSDIRARGVRSKLKLKKDLVDFLEEHLQQNGKSASIPPQKAERKIISAPSKPSAMPPLPNNPKDALLEKVHRRYPGLLNLPNSTYLEGEDIRRSNHPIFCGSNSDAHTSADMDITFVGTASCTPSHTRGVSCTAVRLNWQRRGVYGYPGSEDTPSSFVGGTWLFDCGECTQVSLMDYHTIPIIV